MSDPQRATRLLTKSTCCTYAKRSNDITAGINYQLNQMLLNYAIVTDLMGFNKAYNTKYYYRM